MEQEEEHRALLERRSAFQRAATACLSHRVAPLPFKGGSGSNMITIQAADISENWSAGPLDATVLSTLPDGRSNIQLAMRGEPNVTANVAVKLQEEHNNNK